jgi:peroxiredoxin/uncharacterized membrane protein YphA (DoxX/SURF4 family)
MDTVLLLVRVALAAVFVLAGVTKLLDLPGSRQAMRDFGLPDPYARYAGVSLPVAELAIAVLLIPRVTAWWGALAALLLLLAFIGGMANVMRQGKAPDCHCFGQVHSEPVGWPSVARNGVLALLALLVVVQGPDGAGPGPIGWWESRSDAAQVALALGTIALALFAIQGWFLFQLMKQNGRLLLRLDELEAAANAPAGTAPTADPSPRQNQGLATGVTAPEFSLDDLTGQTHSLASLRAAGKPVVLVFTDAKCRPCELLMPDIASWQRTYADRLTVAVVARGDIEVNRKKAETNGVSTVLVQSDKEVSEAYNAIATPTGVLVLPGGTIGKASALGADAIRNLVAQQVTTPSPPLPDGRPAVPIGLSIGEPAPDLALESLDGEPASLADFQGEKTLALFWNTQCGYCTRMLPHLKDWEANPPEGAPRLVVISRGSAEDNAAQGLTSPVLLDNQGAGMRSFGVAGTPGAVLIDADGKVASRVALGADAVLQLAGTNGAP